MKFSILAGVMLMASQVSWAQDLAPAAPTAPVTPAPIPVPAPAAEKLHSKFRVNVPYGLSYVDYKLAKPMAMNPLRVLYTVQPSCPLIPNTNVSVKYEGTTGWQKTTYANNGYFQHTNQKVTDIRFTLQQNVYQTESCELNIFTKTAPVQEQEQVYVGYLPYNGGFSKDLGLSLIQTFKGDKIRFDVPEFCKDLQFYDVRLTDSQQKLVVLKKTGPYVFEMNEAHEFDKISLTLNGPRESCDIPVYVYQDVD